MISLTLSGLLLFAIIGHEGWRRTTHQPFGLLSVANIVFALNFCVPPLFVAIIGGTDLETNPFGKRLFLFRVMEQMNLDMGAYASATWIVVLAYVVMLIVYLIVTRANTLQISPLSTTGISTVSIAFVGIVLGAIAIAALLLYAAQFVPMENRAGWVYRLALLQDEPTGIAKMVKYGNLVRAGRISVSFGSFQVLVMLGVPSVIFLSAAAIRLRGTFRWVLSIIAIVVWFAVFVRLYHAAGRMELTIFLVFIPLAILLSVRSMKARMLGGGALLLFGMFMGLASHTFFPQPTLAASTMATTLFGDFGRAILFLLNEFSFPYVMSANTIQVVPEVVPYRYFIDLPLALLYMLPSFSGVDTWPEMISHIHNKTAPLMMPYDLVSFGYYSLGWAGVVVVFAALGAALAVMDRWLTPGTDWLAICLRTGWMLFLPFRIMYADPYTSMKTGFGLIVGTVLVLMMVWVAKRWGRA